jgi:hypothetical protein
MVVSRSLNKLLSGFIFALLLLTFSLVAGAQNKIDFKGRILDNETNEPLSFVSIGIPSSGTGVISNEFGEFNYHVPENFEDDKIQISHLGYKKVQINVAEIKSGVLIAIKLEPEIQMLNEIEIKGMKGIPAADIVSKAIRKIYRNYSKRKTLFYGYYRDYIKEKSSNEYKNLLEAAVIIQDRGYNFDDYQESKIKLEQIRYNPGLKTDSLLNSGYDGKTKRVPYAKIKEANELALLRLQDPIRNHSRDAFSFVYTFDYDFVPEHTFRYESIIGDEISKIFEISFEKHVDWSRDTITREYWVEGKIYINSKDYAILRLDYTVTCKLPTYSGKFFDLKLEYKNLNGKYYLNYMSLMNYFEFKNNPAVDSLSKNTAQLYQYRELFINKIADRKFESLNKKDAIHKDSSLIKNRVPVINGFWESYNYTSNLKLLE